jgi:hypothetical protein
MKAIHLRDAVDHLTAACKHLREAGANRALRAGNIALANAIAAQERAEDAAERVVAQDKCARNKKEA